VIRDMNGIARRGEICAHGSAMEGLSIVYALRENERGECIVPLQQETTHMFFHCYCWCRCLLDAVFQAKPVRAGGGHRHGSRRRHRAVMMMRANEGTQDDLSARAAARGWVAGARKQSERSDNIVLPFATSATPVSVAR
jgi:hypothetical protein